MASDSVTSLHPILFIFQTRKFRLISLHMVYVLHLLPLFLIIAIVIVDFQHGSTLYEQ